MKVLISLTSMVHEVDRKLVDVGKRGEVLSSKSPSAGFAKNFF